MDRPSKLNEETLLDAALVVVDENGKTTTTASIAAAVGARVESFYCRFASREVLLLALWARSIRWLQIGFLVAAGSSGDPGGALAAVAAAVPRYYREYPGKARSLTLSRHEEALARLEAGSDEFAACPGDLREAVQGLNDEVAATMADLTRRRFESLESLELMWIAVQQTTYGLMYPFSRPGTRPIPV